MKKIKNAFIKTMLFAAILMVMVIIPYTLNAEIIYDELTELYISPGNIIINSTGTSSSGSVDIANNTPGYIIKQTSVTLRQNHCSEYLLTDTFILPDFFNENQQVVDVQETADTINEKESVISLSNLPILIYFIFTAVVTLLIYLFYRKRNKTN